MKKTAFPTCCTASIYHDLGGTRLSSGITSKISEADIIKMIEAKLDRKDMYGSIDRNKLVVIITNDGQQQANRALKKLGFEHSAWMRKSQHRESKIRLWWREPDV